MMTKKKIVPIIALIVLVIAIIGIAFQANFIQIGDYVVSDRYYDTAFEAYEHKNDSISVNIKEEITTVNINNNYPVWFAESDENKLALIKMALKDGKYFSIGDVSLYSEKTLSNTSGKSLSCLEDELTLGNEMLKFEILTEEKYGKSPLAKKNYNTEHFTFNNKSYVFAYEVVTE